MVTATSPDAAAAEGSSVRLDAVSKSFPAPDNADDQRLALDCARRLGAVRRERWCRTEIRPFANFESDSDPPPLCPNSDKFTLYSLLICK